MSNISFFTPVRYEGQKTFMQHIHERIEDYFYLGGKSAYVIPAETGKTESQEVVIKNIDQNKVKQVILGAVKIISYIAGLILPLMLAAKAVFLSTYKINTLFFIAGTVLPIMLAAKVIFRFTHKFHYTCTVSTLMQQFTMAWDSEIKDFVFPEGSFDPKDFTRQLLNHAEKFKKENITDQHFGYINKFDLAPSEEPKIYMRADLHGDLKSLIENIRTLQKEGLLDEKFRCKSGVHLVFLGDYCDRGQYGTQILEMLMRLREENPQQVHLIRGNHEYSLSNLFYGAGDKRLNQIVSDQAGIRALEGFYETMSLTTYFSLDEGGKREYVQCTHGLFEPTMDPAPLLDHLTSGDSLPVPKERKLSDRIRKIADSNSALAEAAKQIESLIPLSSFDGSLETAYNWADVTRENQSFAGSLSNRTYALCARDIRHYFDLSSEQHRVMMLFRGHQHGFQHLMHEDKVLVTTLPVGMDCPAYQYKFNQPDRAYIIKPRAKVEDWNKRAILREKGNPLTDEVTQEFALTSSEV